MIPVRLPPMLFDRVPEMMSITPSVTAGVASDVIRRGLSSAGTTIGRGLSSEASTVRRGSPSAVDTIRR